MKNESFALEVEHFFGYFINELKLTNKSKYTIMSYKSTINSFLQFIIQYDKSLSFENFKKIDIINFLDYKNIVLEKQSELKMSSKKLYITHLKTFFIFINENLEFDIKISSIFKINIKLAKITPKGVEKNDVKILEEYLKNLKFDNFITVRTSLILKILLYSGARRGELQVLKTSDFIEDKKIFIINTIGKGSRERTLYIPKIYIENELHYYKMNNIKYISATKTGKTMDGSQIYRFLNNIYKKIGIKYTGAHILRHTFAKNMISKDVNIVTVKELLGHSSIQTTMIYTKPNQKEVQKAYENTF